MLRFKFGRMFQYNRLILHLHFRSEFLDKLSSEWATSPPCPSVSPTPSVSPSSPGGGSLGVNNLATHMFQGQLVSQVRDCVLQCESQVYLLHYR